MKGWRWVVGSTVLITVVSIGWTTPGAPQAEPLAAEPAGPRIAAPWSPGRPQLGVQVYWVDSPADSEDVLRLKARRVLDHVIGMEANAVSVSFPFFSDEITSSAVRFDERTPSPPRLGVVMAEAGRAGLRTTLRPLLDEANLIAQDNRNWRGELDPDDRDAWFASYRDFLAPYLDMAELTGVDTVVIGAELNRMQDDPRWGPLVDWARTRYSGEIGYAANWDAYPGAVAGVPADAVGIDAYPQLDIEPAAGVPEMAGAWRNWLEATAPADPASPLPGLLFYEVGAAAETSTVDNPAVPHRPGTELDEGVQRRWLAAACQVARERGLAGLYLWKIEFDVDPALADPVADLHDSFLGRQAERAIRECFQSWGAVR
jgi:hypothetical protein